MIDLLDTCDALERRAEIAERALAVDLWEHVQIADVEGEPVVAFTLCDSTDWFGMDGVDAGNLRYAIAEAEWEEANK